MSDPSNRGEEQHVSFTSGHFNDGAKRPEKDDGFPLRHDRSQPLWERILAWCQYANWYGADSNPRKFGLERTKSFEYPPASAEEIDRIEEQMGCAHPPLLRDIYLHIANGGFGPFGGLIGIPPHGRFHWLPVPDPRYDKVDTRPYYACRSQDFSLFDLSRVEQLHPEARPIAFDRGDWPSHLLFLCTAYEDDFWVHAKSGYVYLRGSGYDDVLSDGSVGWAYLL